MVQVVQVVQVVQGVFEVVDAAFNKFVVGST
jgi:hypothetical protein